MDTWWIDNPHRIGSRNSNTYGEEASTYLYPFSKNMSDPEPREELEKRIDELAREHAETHNEEVKAEILELGRRLAEMKNHE